MGNFKTIQEPDYTKVIAITGLAILFLGLLAFAGWISGFQILSSYSRNYIPMAPSTAIITMVFGFFFFSGAYKPCQGRRRWISIAVLSFFSLFSFMVILGYIWNNHNFIEDLLFPAIEVEGKFPINHMSPYSGLLFLIVGLAFEINILFAGQKSLPNIISSLGLVVAFAGFVALLGYLFGTPFLYGGHAIPLSVPSSIVFLLLGLGLIFIAGPKGIYLRQFIGNSANARVLRAILPVVLSAIILEDLLDIYISDDLHVNPALLLSLLTVIFSVLTILVVVSLTKNIFRDVERAEREIELQKIKFQQLFENSPIGMAMLDKDENVQFINKSFETIFQYTNDEIQGKNINESIVPFEKAEESLALKGIADSGKRTEIETVRKRKDGSLVPVQVYGVPVSIEDRLMGLYGMYIEITERKQKELESQIQSEIGQSVSTTSNLTELMKLIHDSLRKVVYAENCFFALFDENTRLFSFPYYVDQFDTAPQPLAISKSCTSYVFRSGKPLIITPQLFQRLIEENEVELVGSDSPSWIGIPLKVSSRIIGIMVLQHYQEENVYKEDDLRFLDSIGSQIANVIERRRAKEALEKSFSLVTATLESTADGILVVDKVGKVTNYNRKFKELWRIPESVISTHDDEKLISFVLDQLKDPEGFLQKVNELYSNEEEISFDLLELKDGRIYERYSQAQKFEGASIGRVWSFRNVTERKQAEEALRKSEADLRESNATKDKFFSIISHDLKSPFNSIVGFSSILEEQVQEKNLEGIETYAEIIKSSSQRAMDLLSNLLEWSRSQTNRMAFNSEKIEIVALINNATQLLGDAAQHKSISITKKTPESLMLSADKEMISAILRNLISNAIKFTNPGGTIAVTAEQKKGELMVTVSDNGVGIENSALRRLFRIEESFSTYGTENEHGTGLGLILCKEFIEKHGGKIWAESEVGVGSKFCFTIPMN